MQQFDWDATTQSWVPTWYDGSSTASSGTGSTSGCTCEDTTSTSGDDTGQTSGTSCEDSSLAVGDDSGQTSDCTCDNTTVTTTTHSIDWSYYILYSSLTSSDAYTRVTKRFPYLNTLKLDPNAKAFVQITYDMDDPYYSGPLSPYTLDTSRVFSIGQL